jgi:hypothetical protein
MTIKGKVVHIEQTDFNPENKRAIYELITDNSSACTLFLDPADVIPKEGDNFLAITDSDGIAVNYAINNN